MCVTPQMNTFLSLIKYDARIMNDHIPRGLKHLATE